MEVDSALAALASLQKTQLSIIRLRDSIGGGASPKPGSKRTSDASTADGYEDATPASLEAELTHYKEHFKKLRFSYIEQVTKEKFLRQLTSDAPVYIEPSANSELEAKLLEQKASLQAQKAQVADMIAELEGRGRELARRYEAVALRETELQVLPAEIAELEAEVEALRTMHPSPAKSAPHLSLPLPGTQALLAVREAEVSALDVQLAGLQSQMPGKVRELERLERELKPLELQKLGAVAAAKEARRRKEEGDGIGDLEAKGRWLRACEGGLRGMLRVEA